MLTTLFGRYPNVFSVWMGKELYIGLSRPKDLEIILNRCLNKGNVYEYTEDYFYDSLITAPVNIWKERRKVINKAFHMTIINSFAEKFLEGGNSLVLNFKGKCNGEPFDVLPSVWRVTFDVACATLGNVDSNLLKGQDQYMLDLMSSHRIIFGRFYNPLYRFNFFWRRSSFGKEAQIIKQRTWNFIDQMIDLKRRTSDGNFQQNYFLDLLIRLEDEKKMSHEEVVKEVQFMFAASHETTAVTVSAVLLALGMHPDIQERIFEELESIFGKSDRDVTLDDVNKMDYLKRVIKDTLRLFPTIPFIARRVDQDLRTDSSFYPRGSTVLIPMAHLNRKAEFWPDPLKFDPDRFLTEENQNVPRCTFIPFSYGPRNCMGVKYAMLSMQFTLSTLLRQYKVTSSNYKTIQEIDFGMTIVARPKRGYIISIEKRNRYI
ncbi:unnamed protein product [Tenebrio molitor]|nr:unnamed protein product [Tenebrio molitor]